MKFTDTNQTGYDFDAYRLLVQNDHIIPNAISFKDQKLFLGNYTSTMKTDRFVIRDDNSLIQWKCNENKRGRFRHSGIDKRWYDHVCQLNESSDVIRGFKY